ALGSGPLEEAVRVPPEELLPPVGIEARPGEDVVDRVRELAFGGGIVGGVHQHVVTEKSGDGVEHVLSLLSLDAAEKPAARNVFARSMLERRGAANIDRLLVHTPSPEWQPAEAAFEHTHAQARIAVEDAGADKGGDKPHCAPGV